MRRLKTISAIVGLAVCGLVIAAASASASGFVVNNEPSEANYTGSGSVTLRYAGFSTTCTATLAGHMSASSNTLVPTSSTIGSCNSEAKFNGCSITKLISGAEHPAEEYEPGEFTIPYWDGEFEFGPAGCGPITSSTAHSTGDKIYLNEKGSLKYYSQGSGSSKTIEVKFTDNGNYELGPPQGGGLQSGAVLEVSITLKAEQCCGVQAPFEIQPEILTSLGISSSPLQFTSARYPVNVHTSKYWEIMPYWYVRGTNIHCKTANYTTSGLAGPTSTLTLSPGLAGCEYAGLTATAFRNGCNYQFELTSSSGGVFKVTCPEGSSLEFLSYLKSSELTEGKYQCKLTVPSQSGTFTVTAAGGALKPKVSISKLKYTQTRASILCPSGSGTFEDGSFSQEMKLAGSY